MNEQDKDVLVSKFGVVRLLKQGAFHVRSAAGRVSEERLLCWHM